MITDLLSLAIMMAFMGLGLTRPWVALSGVIWVDLFRPQLMSQSFLAGKPLSMVMTVFFLVTLVMNFRKLHRPAATLYMFLVPAFLAWITLTTVYAQFPGPAWFKFDAAFKTILLAFFIPFVLATRRDLELFIWVVVGSMGFFIFTAGAKSILGGGGYGVALINDNPGVLWNEGSTLATQAVALLPLLYVAGKHTALAERLKYLKVMLYGIAFCSFLVLVGTEARTGLIALAALIAMTFGYAKKSRGKIIALAVIAPLAILPFLPSSWMERMDTMNNTKQESSAQGRIVVWRWTVDWVTHEHPVLGGGFNAYLANAGQLEKYSGKGEVVIDTQYGKAFHNIYIEVLGEHGYVGLALFLGIIGHTLRVARRVSRHPQAEEWQKWLGRCIFMSMAVYCIGGMFIGVAFYPWIYYMYGLTIAMSTSLKYTLEAQQSPTGEASNPKALLNLRRRARVPSRAEAS